VIEPDDTNGLVEVSAAQCQHVRAVSRERIVNIRGNVGAALLGQLRETIAVILDLP
jgi:mRNA-degrading endonuclease toxin of MazEF toxin-antitoxin module